MKRVRRFFLAVLGALLGATVAVLYYPGRHPSTPKMTTIEFVNIGDVDRDLLPAMAPAVAQAYAVSYRLAPSSMPLPEQGYNPQRRQYLASSLREQLRALVVSPGQHLLGVTNADVYGEGLNFLFGESDLPGPVSVMSLARLRPRHGNPEAIHALLLERAIKIAIHELGHSVGLEHCPNETCVMHFANSLGDLDRTTRQFDRRCRERLR